jgi:DHA2 family multidrug resistance protein-like MFS transporter
VLNVVAFGCIVAGAGPLMQGAVSMPGFAMLGVGVIAGCLLLTRSCAQPRPLIPLDLLRVPLIALAAATSVGAFAAQMLAFIVLPFYFESALGVSHLQIGAQFMVWCAAVAVVAPLAGQLSDRLPAATLSALGLASFAAGLAALAALSARPSTVDIAWRMAVCGIGFALFQAPNNRTLLSFARPERLGAAAGIQAMARTSGQILGALAASCFLGVASSAWRLALGAGAAFATLGALASVLRRRRGHGV